MDLQPGVGRAGDIGFRHETARESGAHPVVLPGPLNFQQVLGRFGAVPGCLALALDDVRCPQPRWRWPMPPWRCPRTPWSAPQIVEGDGGNHDLTISAAIDTTSATWAAENQEEWPAAAGEPRDADVPSRTAFFRCSHPCILTPVGFLGDTLRGSATLSLRHAGMNGRTLLRAALPVVRIEGSCPGAIERERRETDKGIAPTRPGGGGLGASYRDPEQVRNGYDIAHRTASVSAGRQALDLGGWAASGAGVRRSVLARVSWLSRS